MPETDARRATIERDIAAWERRALKAERTLRQREEELRERLRNVWALLDSITSPIAGQPSRMHPGQVTDAEVAVQARKELLSIFEEADGE